MVDVTVDVVIFTVIDQQLCVLLLQRADDSPKGRWALPGAQFDVQKSTTDTTKQIVKELTGKTKMYQEHLRVFDDPKRSSKGRVMSIAHMALLFGDLVLLRVSKAYPAIRWWPVASLPGLVLDHSKIVKCASQRLKECASSLNVLWSFLPERFSLYTLQGLYELILGKTFDKGNFRRKILSANILAPLGAGELRARNGHRPAELYRFKHYRPESLDLF